MRLRKTSRDAKGDSDSGKNGREQVNELVTGDTINISHTHHAYGQVGHERHELHVLL